MEPIKEETLENENVQKNPIFPFMGIGSLIYAAFYTFCLYKNSSGITYPFFVGGTCLFFFFYLKKSGIFFLFFYMALHNLYQDKDWDLQYF